MKDGNVLLTYNGLEVYENDILYICDEYINRLPDPSMIYKSTVFAGMLRYIYTHCLKDIIESDKQNRNSKTNNYNLLNDVFYNIYIYLCSIYNIVPNIIQFCDLVNIDNTNICDINKGIYRMDGSKVNPATTQTVRKWYSTCESMLLSKATNESSIGSIFALKANYGYRDNVTQLEITNQPENRQTAAEIMEKYRNAELPVIPE